VSKSRAVTSDSRPSPSDRRLLRRASAVVAVQTAGAAALVVAAVIALVYSFSQRERYDATVDKTQEKAAHLLEEARRGGNDAVSGTTSGSLDGLPDDDECRASVGGWHDALPPGDSEVDICGEPFIAYIAEEDGLRVAAARNFT
jgi:hypothetical protein